MLTLTNSTVSGNSVPGVGGGISNDTGATLTLTNSTVSGNSASGQDSSGGITFSGSKADIIFCTIYGNKATGKGGGLSIGDGQDSNGNNVPSQVSIRNSIIAGDHAPTGPDISGRLTSDGYNLIQDTSGASFTPNKQHLTDILGNKFPNLGIDPLLQDNGGLAKPHTFTGAYEYIDKPT